MAAAIFATRYFNNFEKGAQVLRALWFFFQLGIVAAAAVWISSQSGRIDIAWNDYTVSAHLGVFLLILAVFILLVVVAFRLIGALVGMPDFLKRKRREKNRIKAFQSLTRGFVAIAAGEGKKASAHARDVRRLVPDEKGLPLLLEAQAARLRGEEEAARKAFEALLEDKDAGFFGVKGLLKSSIESGDRAAALGFARKALEKNPKQPWVLKSVYELEIENHNYAAAMLLLERAKKYEAVDPGRASKDEIALLLVLAEQDRQTRNGAGELSKLERAVKLDPSFAPSSVRLAEYHLAHGKRGKAVATIEKAWRRAPHRDLETMWESLAPDNGGANETFTRLRWAEKLVEMRPDAPEGKLAAAKAAMEAGLNGEARSYLAAAESIRPTARLYRLYADLEERSGGNTSSVREWLDRAAAAEGDCVWYCTATGGLYETWLPVAKTHGSFNTILWGHPLAAGNSGNFPAKLSGTVRGKAERSDALLIDKD